MNVFFLLFCTYFPSILNGNSLSTPNILPNLNILGHFEKFIFQKKDHEARPINGPKQSKSLTDDKRGPSDFIKSKTMVYTPEV